MTKHVKYGGSTAARTLNCPAWLRLADDLPIGMGGDGSNEAADTGTLLHNCMEYYYRAARYYSFDEMVDAGREYNGITLTSEMVMEKLVPARDEVERLRDMYDIDTIELEPYVQIDEDMAGSIDLLGVSEDGKTVLVLDYKFGYVPVSAERNSQLMFYALAAATDAYTREMFDQVEKIVLAIVQPNEHGDVTDTYTISMDDVDDFETEYFRAVELSEQTDSQPVTGTHCKYCPVAPVCPAKTGAALKASRIGEITAEKLAEYLPLAEQVEEWAKEVKKFAHEQLELGVNIQGYKLVNKRATRKWADVHAVTDKVRKAKKITLAEGFNTVLKSPPQIEKICNEKGIDFDKTYGQYISAVSSGTTMAPADDPRPTALAIAGLEQLNALTQ